MTTRTDGRTERISVGVDGSLASRAAVRWALEHAGPGDSVTLVHIFAVREFHHAEALPHDLRWGDGAAPGTSWVPAPL